ncbi:MAG: hypothetical protein HOP15_18640 [Planctomycetes bacterium]|nr:hypothetical protein [Planctomycetota bacterium]
MNRLLPIAALALLSVLRPWPRTEPPAPLAADRALASLVPERCLVYLDASGLHPVLEQGLDYPFLRALQASEFGGSWLDDLPVSPVEALVKAEAWLGESALLSAAEFTERGLGLGFDPESKKTVVLALGRDADTVARHLGLVFDAIERQVGWPGGLDAPHERWSGAEVWRLGEAVIARREALLVFGNGRDLVAEVLELAADPDGRGLLDRPGFLAHHSARPEDTALWAWFELSALEPHADQGFRDLRGSNHSPAVQAILGAQAGALFSARALSAALALRGEHGLELRLRAHEAPCVTALAPMAREGAVPAELAANGLAQALLYRDFARYFTLRSELFAPESLPDFAEAITNAALLFEGQDLGEEVLARVSPWIRLVSRELEFADERRPEIPLPGVAVVVVLDDERAAEQWTAAFQTSVALINVDQAQKGRKSMRLHLAREGAVEISAARFSTPVPGEGVDVRHNLEPALAVVGRHLVLGTHESLVRELVRELAGARPGAAWDPRETLDLDARGWRAALDQNLEVLVARKMLTDGFSRAAAEQEIRGLCRALAAFEGAHVEFGGEDRSAPELVLELRLARAPTEPRASTQPHAATER